MTFQLFPRYSKLATYVSAAAMPLDMIICVFFSHLEALEAVAFTMIEL